MGKKTKETKQKRAIWDVMFPLIGKTKNKNKNKNLFIFRTVPFLDLGSGILQKIPFRH